MYICTLTRHMSTNSNNVYMHPLAAKVKVLRKIRKEDYEEKEMHCWFIVLVSAYLRVLHWSEELVFYLG